MQITVLPLPIGNAIRVLMSPSQGVTEWKLLRNTTGTFTGENDANSVVLFDGNDDTSVVDVGADLASPIGLVNGTAYSYCAFEFDGEVWSASPVVAGTPQTIYGLGGPDPLSFLRNRLAAGLAAAVAAQTLTPESGSIKVLTAPPLFTETKWPVVTVHLQSDAPGVRGIGEIDAPGEFNLDDQDWTDGEGWLADVRIQIIGWSINPDERIALRQAVKNIIIGNLPVFDSVGMVQIAFSQSDVEDFESYNAPVYQTIGQFSCLAPAIVTATSQPITDVTVTASGDP